MNRRKGKPAWKSKTLWFNLICASVAAVEGTFGVFQGVLAGNVYATLAVVLAAGNAVLRVITTESVS